ncbi:tetratricopeptide repeat-containing sensor histidine kinase [Sphingobacterium sp. SYP-B4668]|uniref:tetratricopeptide repeat-containing sensor histidine kinase n=1 Tax=Sphingobacterium sp. SYP-B4668 TaxID=2996035 RepID=UPI0022DD83E2|nr:sensor histidine kinase [Sphingobacterium sp. SYP-B4668]
MKRYIHRVIQGVPHLSLYLLIALVPMISFGQDLDSLEQLLAKKKLTEQERIDIYMELAQGYLNDDPIRSRSFSLEGHDLAETTGNQKSKAKFLYYLGSSYYVSMVFDSVTFYLDKTLILTRQNEDKDDEVSILKMYGQLYRRQGQYEKALERYFEAAKLGERLEEDQKMCDVYMGIGGTYHLMQNDSQALFYYGKAEKIALKHRNAQNLGDIYLSLSSVYKNEEGGKEKAIHYAKESLKIHHKSGSRSNEISALQTLCGAYFQYDDYTNAMKYAEEALHLAKEIGNTNLIAHSYADISSISYYMQQYEKSAKTALVALETDSTDHHLKLTIFSNLPLIYAHLGNLDAMEEYMERYKTAIDNHSNETYQNSLSAMEVKYETEKKEIKIAALEKQRQLYIWLGIAGATVLLIALAFAFIRYRLAVSKRKLAEKETQRLEQEKQLVAVQATLEGEAAERTRLAKDLHDGLGGMLSAVKMNLPQVKGDALLEAVDVARFQTALGMLDDSIQELRRVAHHMMPESLLRYGLKVSLADFCAAIPTANFHYFGNEARLPGKMEIMIYRCIHELVNNALKHAGASHINLQLVQEPDRVSFTVQDDGKGFDQHTVSEGMGLQNIRQRVDAFQGKLDIFSSEEGTEVHVELELTKNEQHD